MTRRNPRPRGVSTRVRSWLTSPLTTQVKQVISRLERAPDVEHVAIMPDVHLARGVCIGTVLATRQLIYPQAVGADIGCGMSAVAFDADGDVLRSEQTARAVLDGLAGAIPVLRHRSLSSAPPLSAMVADMSLGHASLARASRREGRVELGTLGRGNHFLEFQEDNDGRLWLMVHSGSRAMGQMITELHVAGAERVGGGLLCLDSESPQGQAYLNDVQWARRYADANRKVIIRTVAEMLRNRIGLTIVPDSTIHCDHNHVRCERHLGASLWVHRKGANSAFAGNTGLIPGSMGSRSFHVEGRGCAAALCSSSHGAGRVMSRHDARRRIATKQLCREMRGVWFNERIGSRLCEESPSAYKDIEAVLRAQKDLVRIVRRLRPLLNYRGV